MLICSGEVRRQLFCSNFLRVFVSSMLVAISNVSPASFGAETNRRNSRDLLHRYFFPRQVMSFKPLVDQFAIVVNTAVRDGDRAVFQRSVTTGCRVDSHLNPCSGTGKSFVPIFSPKVKSARCRRRYSIVDFTPLSILICSTPGSLSMYRMRSETSKSSLNSCVPQTYRIASASR